MVAGFEIPTSGKILLDGADITDKAPNQGNVYDLPIVRPFPEHDSCAKHWLWPSCSEFETCVKQRVEEMVTLINLEKHANKYPYQLSGGQQQRVSLWRVR